jgi:hypothetical protein
MSKSERGAVCENVKKLEAKMWNMKVIWISKSII